MKPNMGALDKILRITAAAVIVALFLLDVLPTTLGIILLVVAAIFVATSLFSFCPLYPILEMNTAKKE